MKSQKHGSPCSHITDLCRSTCRLTMVLATFLSEKNINSDMPIYRNERSIEIYASLFCVFPGRKIVEAIRTDFHILKTLMVDRDMI